MEGSHHPVLWEEEGPKISGGDSDSSEEMEEVEPEQQVTDYKEEKEEPIGKPMSEESTPDEDDDFKTRSCKVFTVNGHYT